LINNYLSKNEGAKLIKLLSKSNQIIIYPEITVCTGGVADADSLSGQAKRHPLRFHRAVNPGVPEFLKNIMRCQKNDPQGHSITDNTNRAFSSIPLAINPF